ncbi:MAG: hypothetical protein AAGA50_18765 [Pseudomonadota bacterium]
MPTSIPSQIAASIFIFLGVAYFLAFDAPFVANVIFVALCVMWSAWIFISIFRGTDEPKAAGVRYALAVASGVGAPLSLAFVMLMIATPDIQRAIASLAVSSGSPPAAAGFGLGVSFTIIVLCTVLVISHSIWWASKR